MLLFDFLQNSKQINSFQTPNTNECVHFTKYTHKVLAINEAFKLQFFKLHKSKYPSQILLYERKNFTRISFPIHLTHRSKLHCL